MSYTKISNFLWKHTIKNKNGSYNLYFNAPDVKTFILFFYHIEFVTLKLITFNIIFSKLVAN